MKGNIMSTIREDIEYLSQEVGPRPAGTEEEQQAALYIADQMQKRSGFAANIEDFSTMVQPGIVEAICFGVAALVSLLAIAFNVLVIPAFFITLICVMLYAFEIIDRPLLSRVFENGVSQNVVSCYKPGTQGTQRNRKIVLIANYDSGKVLPELKGPLFGVYPALVKASAIALVALPVIWLLRTLFLLHATGGAVVFFNLLAALASILALIPAVLFFVHKTATYNEAANNNAASVAALLEVARQISEGSFSEEELAARAEATIHGADAALAADLVPEGADLSYEVEPQTEEERLAAAKAAVAALTGQPVRSYEVEKIPFTPTSEIFDIDSYEEMDYGEYGYNEEADYAQDNTSTPDLPTEEDQAQSLAEDHFNQDGNQDDEQQANQPAPFSEEATAVLPLPALSEPVSPSVPSSISDTFYAPTAPAEPDWYTTGRAKAVKTADEDMPAPRRSRYADALDAAVASSREHFEEAARMLDEGTIERISQMQRDLKAKHSPAVPADAPLQELLSPSEPIPRSEEESLPATPEESVRAKEIDFTSGAEHAEAPGAAELAATDSIDRRTHEASIPVEDMRKPIEEQAALRPEQHEASASLQEASKEAVESMRADETAVPDVVSSEDAQDFTQDAAAATSDMNDTTTAFAPIDVSTLSEETPEALGADTAGAGSYADHDFSRITSPDSHLNRADVPETSRQAHSVQAARPAIQRNPLLSGAIPRIGFKASEESLLTSEEASEEVQEPEAPERIEDKRAALRSAIPSLSGELSPVVTRANDDTKAEDDSSAGSFTTPALEAAFDPVGSELAADLSPEDRYIEDADDSAFGEDGTETGALAGSGYVEMPTSRLSRFFNRFRKKEDAEETSATQWLDVDEDFNPTEVGKARGGWESFRDTGDEDEYAQDFDQEQISLFDSIEEDQANESADERTWHGGAFSQLRARLMGGEESVSEEAPTTSEEEGEDISEDIADELQADGLEDALVATRVSSHASETISVDDKRIAEETKMVYSFRNPDINTEVWFVALGSEYAGNCGMKAFLAEHANDLRGAIIVNLEAMGAGELSFVEEEGYITTQKPSSRLKRYLRKASEITGVGVSNTRLAWRESAASLAMKRGMQAMTLAGIDAGKPAYLGQGDDVVENVDEAQVAENVQFIMELIKNI